MKPARLSRVVQSVEELLVYQKAMTAVGELFALIRRSELSKDFDLVNQLNDASDSVVANISEGFEHKTDRHFARYLYNARGSAREIRTHLQVAVERRRVSSDEIADVDRMYDEIGRMLAGLIDYLRESDWKDRRR